MKNRGVGYATIFYGTGYGNGFPDESRATAELMENGEIVVYVEVSDVGSGGISVMWQIATETLNIDRNLIKVIYNDTSLIRDSGTAAASRQTYNTGNAVYDVCKKLRNNLDSGANKSKIKSISKEDLKNIYKYLIENEIPTKTEGYFKAETSQIDMETGEGNPYWPYTFGAQKVTVEVDDETGKVDIIEAIAVNDAGKIINPSSAEGQAQGGVAMGIGYALMEEIEIEKGSIKNKNFSNYIIPTSKDVPHIDTYFVEELEESGPYGAKGIGEPVMIPTAPAILNAIYDAVGIRMYSIPVTCDKLLLALKEKKLNL
ncbi:molybdopterin cofactor-binding domain-containing protein [uncultured Clostridium sp.]|uniref:xanthine dehydrogenase family protein molybdopterin-binding subunit n=1 Tax=uncultured Clostridium sp. TaxID=59620 RepID=UPI00321768A9